jgi:twitching motility protein PilT
MDQDNRDQTDRPRKEEEPERAREGGEEMDLRSSQADGLDPELSSYLEQAIRQEATDVHLITGVEPTLRINGQLVPIEGQEPLSTKRATEIIFSFVPELEQSKLKEQKEIDLSFDFTESVRFRANAFYQRGNISASLRLIPSKIRSLEELRLPPVIEKFSSASQGFLIVTGPTGHGKSTTLASMINHINKERQEHIITIEDPVEYVFKNKKSLIEQREVYNDTNSFGRALRSALRQDPNIILVGEMRDLETITATLTLAETGHLVLSTLHTNTASQTADRIIDVFPAHQQQQVRQQFANTLLGIVSQRLIPRKKGGRTIACEILIATDAVRNAIREGKTHHLPNVIQTSASEGMIGLDKALAELVDKGEISLESALNWAINPDEFKMKVY